MQFYFFCKDYGTPWTYTGCSLNIVFFSEDYKIFRTLAFLCFSLVSVCVHTHPAGRTHQRFSRAGRVQKNSEILRKKHNN